jgi:hypothetical protein
MSMKVESVVTLQGNDELLTQTMEFQMTNHHDAVTVSVNLNLKIIKQGNLQKKKFLRGVMTTQCSQKTCSQQIILPISSYHF